MLHRLVPLAIGLATAVHGMHGTAQGQPAADWNRRLEAVAVTPSDAASATDVRVVVSVEASDLTAPIDLSTIVEPRINGTTVAEQTLEFSASPSGAGPCGGSCGFFEMCVCGTDPTGVFGCQCSSILSWATFNTSLQPGGEIMVVLRPAPGAVPEPDQTDDVDLFLNEGPRYWDRRILSATLAPRPGGGPQDFDLTVEMDVMANHPGMIDLSFDFEVLQNGVSLGTFPGATLGDIIWSPCYGNCGEPCAFGIGGVQVGECVLDDVGFGGCACGLGPSIGPFQIQLPPTDPGGLVVVLVPVPGALPELPGFPEDEEEIPGCATDLDADGVTGFGDLIFLLSEWGPCEGDCPADLNDDGVVGFADLVQLLSAWGPCWPV